jgi:hypothetical protein
LATAAMAAFGSAAKATDYTGPFSTDNTAPTSLSFTLGGNTVTGTSGGFVSNYMTFTIPTGEALSSIVVLDGSPAPDRFFFGIASGDEVVVDPSFTSAAGLIGWTLFSDADDNTDVLPALGVAAPPNFPAIPGATGFTPPLGAGVYSTWVVDGDGATNAVPFKLNFVLSAVPEPATWALALVGFGAIGVQLRSRRRLAV